MNQRYPYKKTLQASDRTPKLTKYFAGALFFCGVVLTIFEINIFRKTIIDWKIPGSIWLGTGLVSIFFTRKYLEHETKNIFMQLFINICGVGGILAYSFMATNYYLLDDKTTETIKTKIIKTGHLAKGKSGCEEPYADVRIKDFEKKLIYPCDFEMDKYRFVIVRTKKGFWGYNRILSQVPTIE
jgi:hypothetical protein